MFSKILIANRGEIACRITHTARRLGIRTVAVYSEADANALHVALADEALAIGPAPAAESYLRADRIVEAACRAGAAAVHPGYGFLAENAGFAEACAAAGIVFVGPPAAAIYAMGMKSEAKAIMARAGVPVVPGYHGADQDDAVLRTAAAEIGYPVLLKPSAGGGGKGMRRVDAAADFAAALAAARREAKSAFGDDRMLVEKYLTRPRHVELQVFADTHGNFVHLFERDCSIQRRHQKVIEEAPAFGLAASRRQTMGEVAVAAAQAIGYVGAGTIEFLVDEDGFYFMEMNTRLQVEHPVTEMVTGQDLVEWQLRVACGEKLPLSQDRIILSGHAVEARVYAEDPARDFLPATGRLVHLRLPPADEGVRVDAGVRQGDEVSIHYDPLLAKVVAHGPDRPVALRRLAAALAAFQAVGVATNVAFLSTLVRHPAFAAGAIDTGFIERHRAELVPAAGPAPDDALALACLDHLLRRETAAAAAASLSFDPHAPWHRTGGWRLNLEGYDRLRLRDGKREVEIRVGYGPDGVRLGLPGGTMSAAGALTATGELRAELGGRPVTATVVGQGPVSTVLVDGAVHRLEVLDPRTLHAGEEVPPGRLTAPMPGRVIQVAVRPGDRVRRGDTLMVLEAMKMEHAIAAPADGTIAAVHRAVGDLVEDGAELLAFATAEPES